MSSVSDQEQALIELTQRLQEAFVSQIIRLGGNPADYLESEE